MSRPNTAQIRLLAYLAQAPGAGFVAVNQVDQARAVRAGDELFLPSLVARGWAEMDARRTGYARITDAGRSALADLD